MILPPNSLRSHPVRESASDTIPVFCNKLEPGFAAWDTTLRGEPGIQGEPVGSLLRGMGLQCLSEQRPRLQSPWLRLRLKDRRPMVF